TDPDAGISIRHDAAHDLPSQDLYLPLGPRPRENDSSVSVTVVWNLIQIPRRTGTRLDTD
ncbi:MAG TPA: hypothetical protein VN648_05580, partial [Candidatus Methylomirabilis sp.]|nr:hypothetical protein [Candidatus Methylomirabilis sp.]